MNGSGFSSSSGYSSRSLDGLRTDFMISLGMILLNFYLLYDAMGD